MTMVDCETCEGHGVILKYTVRFFPGDDADTEEFDCPDCDGRGEVDVYEPEGGAECQK